MRAINTLLRIVLCLAIAVNGPTLAAAAVVHSLTGAGQIDAADHGPLATAAVPDCHETQDASTEPSPSIPECCKTSSCAGLCMILASAVVSSVAPAPVVIDHSRVAEAPALSFVSFQPHPASRPPIAG